MGEEEPMKRVLLGLKLSVVASVVALVLAGTANAQSFPMKGRFTLPYEVRWGLAVLPAGPYTIEIASVHSPAIVCSAAGRVRAVLPASSVDRSMRGRPTSLQVIRRENRRLVYALNWREEDLFFVYTGLTTAERKDLAMVRDSALPPTVIAQK
jgi:hypothetical protein